MHARRLVVPLLAIGALLGLSGATATANSLPKSVLYSSTAPGAPNLPSLSVEAYSFNQIGDEVLLRRVTKIKSVTVTMSDWACESGSWNTDDCLTTPGDTFLTAITLNVYKLSTTAGPMAVHPGETTPGGLLLTKTKTFEIPYRPSASPQCTGDDAGKWFKNGQGCFSGLAHNITFTLSGLRAKLPKDVVWGVSYNSDHSGPPPIGGATAPQDSLNVGLAPKVRAGKKRYPNTAFWDTRFAGFTCAAAPTASNNGPFVTDVVTGVFNMDGPCEGAANSWDGYIPAAQFNATS